MEPHATPPNGNEPSYRWGVGEGVQLRRSRRGVRDKEPLLDFATYVALHLREKTALLLCSPRHFSPVETLTTSHS